MALVLKLIAPVPLTVTVRPPLCTEPDSVRSAVRSARVFAADCRTNAAGDIAVGRFGLGLECDSCFTSTTMPATVAATIAMAAVIRSACDLFLSLWARTVWVALGLLAY